MQNKLLFWAIILNTIFIQSCNANKKLEKKSHGINDSIFYNVEDSTKDRILLYDKKYYISISESNQKKDNFLILNFGKYHYINDTAFFNEPDSTDKPNRFFCFCKNEFQIKNEFQLKNSNKNYSSEGIDYAYNAIFNRKKHLDIVVTEGGNFYAIKKGDILEFIQDKKKYVLLK